MPNLQACTYVSQHGLPCENQEQCTQQLALFKQLNPAAAIASLLPEGTRPAPAAAATPQSEDYHLLKSMWNAQPWGLSASLHVCVTTRSTPREPGTMHTATCIMQYSQTQQWPSPLPVTCGYSASPRSRCHSSLCKMFLSTICGTNYLIVHFASLHLHSEKHYRV
jgi:hypothetical protein